MNDSIFRPEYIISPRIVSYLDSIERQIWLVDNMLLMPKHESWIRREVSVRRAAATTQIEGATLDAAQVSKLSHRGPGGNYTEDEQANINALDAYEFVDYLSDQPEIPIDELVIRELNRKFMRGSPETLTPGVYRKGQNTVGNFIPPDQGDLPGLMRSFALWLRQGDEAIHPVIRAGISHIHLVALHPFWDGNGRTARGLATLILQRSRFGFRKLLSLESYLSNALDHYFTAIERTLGAGFASGYDVTPWLEFFSLSLNAEVQTLMDRMTDWHRMMEDIHKAAANGGWTERQADGWAFATNTGQITRSDYMDITGVSPATASRDLAMLVEAGVLIPEGKTRSRIYRPAPRESEPAPQIPREQVRLSPES